MWRLSMGGVGTQWWMARLLAVSTAVLALVAVSAAQPASEGDLAKKTQNPVSDLISVPFESNFNFGVGPNDDLQYILNVQPVMPFRLSEDWNLITRTIIPLIDQPELGPGVGDVFGLGDIQLSLFLSPAKSGALIWGIGPIFQFPTATDDALGSDKWSAGPTAAALTIRGPWVLGALVNHLWSLAGDDDRADVNQTLIQPIVTYNLPGAGSSPPCRTSRRTGRRTGTTGGPCRSASVSARSTASARCRWASSSRPTTTSCGRTTPPSGPCGSGSTSSFQSKR